MGEERLEEVGARDGQLHDLRGRGMLVDIGRKRHGWLDWLVRCSLVELMKLIVASEMEETKIVYLLLDILTQFQRDPPSTPHRCLLAYPILEHHLFRLLHQHSQGG